MNAEWKIALVTGGIWFAIVLVVGRRQKHSWPTTLQIAFSVFVVMALLTRGCEYIRPIGSSSEDCRPAGPGPYNDC